MVGVDSLGESMTLKAGVGQLRSEPGDIDGNLARHLEMIEQAREQGVELLVFPELSLTGYQIGRQMPGVALPRDHPLLKQLSAKAGTMTVIVGFIEEAPAAQYHNVSVALRGGELKFIHRKLNLASYGNLEEHKYFAAGRFLETFSLQPPWVAAILICADMWNPGLVHLAALNGATMLITPIASSVEAVGGDFSNEIGWGLTGGFYATMYGMPVLVANYCGEQDGHIFWGGSRIIDPYGKELAVADDEEKLITAELSYEDVRKARFRLPTVRDSNLDLIHREIERLANRLGVPRDVRSF